MAEARPEATEPPAELAELGRMAVTARAMAYAPYSRFRVGAAVQTRDGRVFSGANIENASYGLTVCAERNAILQAALAGARDLVALAVASTTTPPAAPCGLCRQTLAEFAGDDCAILLIGEGGGERRTRLGELLPLAFRPAALGVVSVDAHDAEDAQDEVRPAAAPGEIRPAAHPGAAAPPPAKDR